MGALEVRLTARTDRSAELKKRSTPAIFLIDRAALIAYTFGPISAYVSVSGRLYEPLATAARYLIEERFADGGTKAAIVDDLTIRLICGTRVEGTLHCILIERLRMRDHTGDALERYQIRPYRRMRSTGREATVRTHTRVR